MSLTVLEAAAIVVAGAGAGAVNAIIGSGSLITFPTLVACGYSPVVANVSNNIGLVPGALAGSIGYRRELRGQGARARSLPRSGRRAGRCSAARFCSRCRRRCSTPSCPPSWCTRSSSSPCNPRVAGWVASRRRAGARDVGVAPLAVTFLAGIYGGYFGAAQGIILVGALGVLVPDALERTDALKNVLSGCVNAAAALLFVVVADVAWEAVALIAVGSVIGGTLGARYGRRIPSHILRPVIVTYGLGVALYLLTRH